MKKIVYMLAVLIPILWGCSDSVVNPISENQTISNQKSWITLPKNPGMRVEDEYSASKVITGETGGSVALSINYKTTSSVTIKIDAEIDVPAGAYSGDKNITIIMNSTDGTATFYPSPETFNKPLVFNLKMEGVDLGGCSKSLEFDYIAPDGSFAPVECKKTIVNTGVIKVDDALIPHFSKYGWCR